MATVSQPLLHISWHLAMVDISNLPSITPHCFHFTAPDLRRALLFGMGNITGCTLNPGSMFFFFFFFRVAIIHINWHFWELLHNSEHVDFPHIGKIPAYSQRRCFVGCFMYKCRNRQKMLTLWLFAIRLFSLSLSVLFGIYIGNDWLHSGTNNAPAADINCSKFLPSLLQVKSLLAFLIKLFFSDPIKWYGFLKESWRTLMGSRWRVVFIHCSSVLYTERLYPVSTYGVPLQTHLK